MNPILPPFYPCGFRSFTFIFLLAIPTFPLNAQKLPEKNRTKILNLDRAITHTPQKKDQLNLILEKVFYLYAYLPDSAWVFTEGVIQMAQQDSLEEQEAKAYYYQGIILHQAAKLNEAVTKFKATLAYYNQTRKGAKIAQVTSWISRCFNKMGKTDSAVHYLNKALDFGLKTKNTTALLNVYGQLGEFYLENSDYHISKKYYKRAMNLSTGDYGESLGINMVGYANALNELQVPDSALWYYQTAAQKLEANQDYYRKAIAESGKGNVYMKTGDYQAAIDVYRRVLQTYDAILPISYRINLYGNLATAFSKAGNRDSSDHYYHFTQNAFLLDRIKITFNQAEMLKEEGDWEQAYGMLQEYLVLKDTLSQQEKEQAKQQLDTRYESAQKELLLSQKELLITQEKLKNNRLESWLWVIGISLFAGITFFFFRERTNKLLITKEKELHAEQTERLLARHEANLLEAESEARETEQERIGKELHDQLGILFTAVGAQFDKLDDEKVTRQLNSSEIEAIRTGKEVIHQASLEMRNIARDLSSGVLKDFGLVAALRALADVIDSTGKAEGSLKAPFEISDISSKTERGILWIARELVNNSLKHANPHTIEMTLEESGSNLVLVVKDDGTGFETVHANENGQGLHNIQQRASNIGGSINLTSSPGQGTLSVLDVPKRNG
ncbi:MAG: ATP-binding protein [Bacteroidota bacterium]